MNNMFNEIDTDAVDELIERHNITSDDAVLCRYGNTVSLTKNGEIVGYMSPNGLFTPDGENITDALRRIKKIIDDINNTDESDTESDSLTIVRNGRCVATCFRDPRCEWNANRPVCPVCKQHGDVEPIYPTWCCIVCGWVCEMQID